MDETMSIPERIKELRTSKNWKLEYLAERTGISRSTLAKYESNDYKDMSVFVLLKLADIYDVSMDYLTGLSPNKKNSDADFSKLHLSDEGIEVLKDESWNHALLDEILTNENFKNLMVDSQVYVDRYAESIIKDSLHLLQALKSNYLLNCGTENNEVYLRMLDMVNLNDEDYLLPVIHHDLDSILSIVQMPPGIPVATVGVNGAQNAALLAVQILAQNDTELATRFRQQKEGLKEKIVKANKELSDLQYPFKTN